jgi:cytosine/uracil/thiamine/allantoin permease
MKDVIAMVIVYRVYINVEYVCTNILNIPDFAEST